MVNTALFIVKHVKLKKMHVKNFLEVFNQWKKTSVLSDWLFHTIVSIYVL